MNNNNSQLDNCRLRQHASIDYDKPLYQALAKVPKIPAMPIARVAKMVEIEHSRPVYVLLAFARDRKECVISTLLDYGFDKKQIVLESAARAAQVGDYAVYPIIENENVRLMVSRVKHVKTPNTRDSMVGDILDRIDIKKC